MGSLENTIEILPEFEKFRPMLVGKGSHKHFVIDRGYFYCVRKSCDGCDLSDGCEFTEERIQTSPLVHPRRGMGLEDTPFLVLQFKDNLTIQDLPKELWDNEFSDKSLYPANNHWLLTDYRKTKFHILKGHIRYYGSESEFKESKYSEYLDIFTTYVPEHLVMAFDFSAIEPRIATIVSREPKWMEEFKGSPKVIYKEVRIEGDASEVKSIHKFDDRTYCYLLGELDKDNYESQCSKCPAKDSCEDIQVFYKNISGDWHGINAQGLYPEYNTIVDKFEKKDLRDISKIVALALLYGGSSFTVSSNMGETKEKSQLRIDNFFRELPVASQYMKNARQAVIKTGKVFNLFGRSRDMTKWSQPNNLNEKGLADFKQNKRDIGYAERTALNHPIQSTACDVLKVAMIRVDQLIRDQKWCPIAGQSIPQHLDLSKISYLDLTFAMISSVHDEIVYLISEKEVDRIANVVYNTMQLEDVMESFGSSFPLELDCEYDPYRSWTGTSSVPPAKTYLMRYLQNPSDLDANILLIDPNQLTDKLVEKLNSHTPRDDSKFFIGCRMKGLLYYFKQKRFSLNFLTENNIPFVKGSVNEKELIRS